MATQPDADAAVPSPTRAELGILGVLWERGPCTVRAVHEALSAESRTGYTTVLKLLQIMHRKGLVTRDDSRRAHVYQPASRKEQVQGQLTRELIQRAFAGSRSQLVMQALGSGPAATREELDEIRQLLNRIEDSDHRH